MTPPQPDREQEVVDQALDWMQSNAAKIIATRVVPWALPFIGIACAWLQNVLGLDLTQAEVVGILGPAMLGVSGVLFAWVRGRMHRQTTVATALLELQKLQVAGAAALPVGYDAVPPQTDPLDEVAPTQPPGLEPR